MSELRFIPEIVYPDLDDYNPRNEDGKLDPFKLQTGISDYLRRSFVVFDGFDFYRWNHNHDYIYSKLNGQDEIDSIIVPFLEHFKIPITGRLLNDLTRTLRTKLLLRYNDPSDLMETKIGPEFCEISPDEQLEPYRCDDRDPRAPKLRVDYPLFAFNNGLLNFTTGELLPFTPYIFVTDSDRICCDWDPGASSEDGERFLGGLFEDPRTLNTMLDMMAYAVYRTKYDKTQAYIWILYGKGNTGKTRTFDIISRLLGVQNISTLRMEELCKDFGRSSLIGKRASLSEEVSETNLEANWLKDFSNGSGTSKYFEISRKYRESEKHLINCTFITATNNRIRIGYDSGMARRLRVIPYRINQENNEDLIRSVLDDDLFYSWLAKILYERWIEIQKRNGFIEESPEVDKATNETLRAGSSIKEFLYETAIKSYQNNTIGFSEIPPNIDFDDPEIIADVIVNDPEYRKRPRLWQTYQEWCHDTGRLITRKGEFNSTLENEYGLTVKRVSFGELWIRDRRD